MTITLTPTATTTPVVTLTANTVNGPVTLPITDGKFRNALWRRYLSHSPRPVFVRDPQTGISTRTF